MSRLHPMPSLGEEADPDLRELRAAWLPRTLNQPSHSPTGAVTACQGASREESFGAAVLPAPQTRCCAVLTRECSCWGESHSPRAPTGEPHRCPWSSCSATQLPGEQRKGELRACSLRECSSPHLQSSTRYTYTFVQSNRQSEPQGDFQS